MISAHAGRPRNIRQIGGEVWGELWSIEGANDHWDLAGRFVDVLMGVLARHVGETIATDEESPFAPRQLAGDVWAEIGLCPGANDNYELVNRFVAVLMSALARHEGAVIVNDEDVPVEALTPRGACALEG